MFKSYATLAWRNLFRDKTTSIINIMGLALGLAASIIISIINYSELTWDRFWPEAEKIYKVESIESYQGPESASPSISLLFKGLLVNSFSEITHAGRVNATSAIVKAQLNEYAYEESIVLVDDEVFQIFPQRVISGDITQFFKNPIAVVLTKETAVKYFGEKNAIGETITIKDTTANEGDKVYKVVAIIESSSQKTDVQFSIAIHFPDKIYDTNDASNWRYKTANTYIKLKNSGDIEHIRKNLLNFLDRNVPASAFIAASRASEKFQLTIIPLKDAHMKGAQHTGDSQRVWMLWTLAAASLLIAAINYINLTTAKSIRRQKEIALRKSLGAKQIQIIYQFLIEALATSSIALFLALVLVEVSTPYLEAIFNFPIERLYLSDPILLCCLVTMVIFNGVLAGAYPAFYLSRLHPAKTLKANKSVESMGSSALRRYLVIIQFMIATILICLVATVTTQLHLVLQYDPGYQTKNIVFFNSKTLCDAEKSQKDTLKFQLSNITGVEAVSATFPLLSGSMRIPGVVSVLGQKPEQAKAVKIIPSADSTEFALFKIPMLAGSTYKDSDPSDNTIKTVIISQQAAKNFGFKTPAEAIGKQLELHIPGNPKHPLVVAGVVADTHLGSHNEVPMPFVFWRPKVRTCSIGIRYEGADKEHVIAQSFYVFVEALGAIPSKVFIEDLVAKEYENQIVMSKFIYIFSVIAIFISCIGLFGLATFNTQKRSREICIRKIHGASVAEIIKLLIWQFTKPILIANLIAAPIAIYLIWCWLDGFYQRIDLWLYGPIFCAAAGIISTLIAWLTVGGQALIAAREKPLAALREE